MNASITISSLSDIAKLRSMTRAIPRITVTGGGPRSQLLESKLNRYRDPCGCAVSATCLVTTVLVGGFVGLAWWQAASWGLAAAIAGKLIGIVVGRRLFRYWLDEAARDLARP